MALGRAPTVTLLALCACGEVDDPYVLDGTWTGYVECGSNPRAAWDLSFAADGDAGEFSAPATVSDLTFLLRVEIPADTLWTDDSSTATADIDDCFGTEGEEIPCWTATAVVGPAEDTMTGTFSDYPYTPGSCTWDLSRPFYP